MPARENLQTEHQRETAFLKHLILYDNTGEHRELAERITQIQRNERCVRRGMFVMVVFTALAVAGLGYAAILLEDFPQNKSQLIIKVFSALGLGSLISLVAFAVLWVGYRWALDRHREECRRLVTKLLESRLGQPQIMLPTTVVVKKQASETVEPINCAAARIVEVLSERRPV